MNEYIYKGRHYKAVVTDTPANCEGCAFRGVITDSPKMKRIYTEKDVMVSYNTYGTVLSIGDRFRIYNGYEFEDAMVAFLSWLNEVGV